MHHPNRMAPRILSVVAVCLLAGVLLAGAADLVPEFSRPLGDELAWPLDLAVGPDGTTWVLGRDAADRGYVVVEFDPAGKVVSRFGGEHLYAPLRIARTDAGRIVVSEVCRQPGCTPALVVFAPGGKRERIVDLPRGTVTDLASFGGEMVGAVTQFMGDAGAHLGFRLVDVARGVVERANDDVVPADGVESLVIQKAPSLDNCQRDLFVAPAGGDRFVVAYSGRNEFRVVPRGKGSGETVALPAFTPRLLAPRAAEGEREAEEIARKHGREYHPGDRCGFYRGVATLPGGDVVFAGRGERDGKYLAAVVGPDGKAKGELWAPCELNWTLAFQGERAWAICGDEDGGYVLHRFAVR